MVFSQVDYLFNGLWTFRENTGDNVVFTTSLRLSKKSVGVMQKWLHDGGRLPGYVCMIKMLARHHQDDVTSLDSGSLGTFIFHCYWGGGTILTYT